jgi:hypothetical protein
VTAHHILGVDPGLSGALALYGGPNDLQIFDIPTTQREVNGSLKRQIDPYQLGLWLEIHRHLVAFAMIELVSPMPNKFGKGMGVTSAFTFGFTTGVIHGCIADNQIPIRTVMPAVWKRKFGLIGQGKDASRGAASRLLPKHAGQWPLKKHDGRAEAALLAIYGSLIELPTNFGGTD